MQFQEPSLIEYLHNEVKHEFYLKEIFQIDEQSRLEFEASSGHVKVDYNETYQLFVITLGNMLKIINILKLKEMVNGLITKSEVHKTANITTLKAEHQILAVKFSQDNDFCQFITANLQVRQINLLNLDLEVQAELIAEPQGISNQILDFYISPSKQAIILDRKMNLVIAKDNEILLKKENIQQIYLHQNTLYFFQENTLNELQISSLQVQKLTEILNSHTDGQEIGQQRGIFRIDNLLVIVTQTVEDTFFIMTFNLTTSQLATDQQCIFNDFIYLDEEDYIYQAKFSMDRRRNILLISFNGYSSFVTLLVENSQLTFQAIAEKVAPCVENYENENSAQIRKLFILDSMMHESLTEGKVGTFNKTKNTKNYPLVALCDSNFRITFLSLEDYRDGFNELKYAQERTDIKMINEVKIICSGKQQQSQKVTGLFGNLTFGNNKNEKEQNQGVKQNGMDIFKNSNFSSNFQNTTNQDKSQATDSIFGNKTSGDQTQTTDYFGNKTNGDQTQQKDFFGNTIQENKSQATGSIFGNKTNGDQTQKTDYFGKNNYSNQNKFGITNQETKPKKQEGQVDQFGNTNKMSDKNNRSINFGQTKDKEVKADDSNVDNKGKPSPLEENKKSLFQNDTETSNKKPGFNFSQPNANNSKFNFGQFGKQTNIFAQPNTKKEEVAPKMFGQPNTKKEEVTPMMFGQNNEKNLFQIGKSKPQSGQTTKQNNFMQFNNNQPSVKNHGELKPDKLIQAVNFTPKNNHETIAKPTDSFPKKLSPIETDEQDEVISSSGSEQFQQIKFEEQVPLFTSSQIEEMIAEQMKKPKEDTIQQINELATKVQVSSETFVKMEMNQSNIEVLKNVIGDVKVESIDNIRLTNLEQRMQEIECKSKFMIEHLCLYEYNFQEKLENIPKNLPLLKLQHSFNSLQEDLSKTRSKVCNYSRIVNQVDKVTKYKKPQTNISSQKKPSRKLLSKRLVGKKRTKIPKALIGNQATQVMRRQLPNAFAGVTFKKLNMVTLDKQQRTQKNDFIEGQMKKLSEKSKKLYGLYKRVMNRKRVTMNGQREIQKTQRGINLNIDIIEERYKSTRGALDFNFSRDEEEDLSYKPQEFRTDKETNKILRNNLSRLDKDPLSLSFAKDFKIHKGDFGQAKEPEQQNKQFVTSKTQQIDSLLQQPSIKKFGTFGARSQPDSQSKQELDQFLSINKFKKDSKIEPVKKHLLSPAPSQVQSLSKNKVKLEKEEETSDFKLKANKVSSIGTNKESQLFSKNKMESNLVEDQRQEFQSSEFQLPFNESKQPFNTKTDSFFQRLETKTKENQEKKQDQQQQHQMKNDLFSAQSLNNNLNFKKQSDGKLKLTSNVFTSNQKDIEKGKGFEIKDSKKESGNEIISDINLKFSMLQKNDSANKPEQKTPMFGNSKPSLPSMAFDIKTPLETVKEESKVINPQLNSNKQSPNLFAQKDDVKNTFPKTDFFKVQDLGNKKTASIFGQKEDTKNSLPQTNIFKIDGNTKSSNNQIKLPLDLLKSQKDGEDTSQKEKAETKELIFPTTKQPDNGGKKELLTSPLLNLDNKKVMENVDTTKKTENTMPAQRGNEATNIFMMGNEKSTPKNNNKAKTNTTPNMSQPQYKNPFGQAAPIPPNPLLNQNANQFQQNSSLTKSTDNKNLDLNKKDPKQQPVYTKVEQKVEPPKTNPASQLNIFTQNNSANIIPNDTKQPLIQPNPQKIAENKNLTSTQNQTTTPNLGNVNVAPMFAQNNKLPCTGNFFNKPQTNQNQTSNNQSQGQNLGQNQNAYGTNNNSNTQNNFNQNTTTQNNFNSNNQNGNGFNQIEFNNQNQSGNFNQTRFNNQNPQNNFNSGGFNLNMDFSKPNSNQNNQTMQFNTAQTNTMGNQNPNSGFGVTGFGNQGFQNKQPPTNQNQVSSAQFSFQMKPSTNQPNTNNQSQTAQSNFLNTNPDKNNQQQNNQQSGVGFGNQNFQGMNFGQNQNSTQNQFQGFNNGTNQGGGNTSFGNNNMVQGPDMNRFQSQPNQQNQQHSTGNNTIKFGSMFGK